MSKQIKIFLAIGAVIIVVLFGYWMWPVGEPDAEQRGVSLDTVEEPE